MELTETITRVEHEEFKQRMQEEHKRQNRRLEQLESTTKEIQALAISVERLAQSIQSMVKEQETQGERLEVLENRDGEMWRRVTGYIITAIIGIVLGYIFNRFGF